MAVFGASSFRLNQREKLSSDRTFGEWLKWVCDMRVYHYPSSGMIVCNLWDDDGRHNNDEIYICYGHNFYLYILNTVNQNFSGKKTYISWVMDLVYIRDHEKLISTFHTFPNWWWEISNLRFDWWVFYISSPKLNNFNIISMPNLKYITNLKKAALDFAPKSH